MTNYHADYWDRFWGDDFNETLGNESWASIKDWGNVSVNFNNSRGVSGEIIDVSDVWIDTDVGGSWFKVVDAYDVAFNFDQYGNSNNSVQVYDADDISFYATGGGNWMKFSDVDDVSVYTDWGGNSVNIEDADDITQLRLGGSGDNWIDIQGADTVNAEIFGGSNTVRINMDQDFWDGDYTRENFVNLNFQGSRGEDDVEISDADDVWIDTDGGSGRFLINDSDDVRVQMDQYNNSNNRVEIYHSLDVSVYATGGNNLMYAGHNDDVAVDFNGGNNTVDIWYADDVKAQLGSDQYDGGNDFRLYDADSLDATIWGGGNQVFVDMNQRWAEGDDFSEESVRLNFNGPQGGNKIEVYDADYTWIDIDGGANSIVLNDTDAVDMDIYGGDNTIRVTDADDVNLDIDDKAKSFNNDIAVTDADDVTITTSEGDNTFRLNDIDSVDIVTVGWRNTIDIDGAGDAVTDGNVYIHNTWGNSRYQDIDVDHADDVTITMANLYDSNIWIANADAIRIDGTAGSTNKGDNTVNVTDVDDVDIDLDGSGNTINVTDAYDVDIDLDDVAGAFGNNVTVHDADDVNITTSEGSNILRLEDVDDVSISTFGWYNTVDIDDADDVVLKAGNGRYQNIDIDDAFDVTLQIGNLQDSDIWVEDADDVVVDGTYGNTGIGGNVTVQLGWSDDSVEDATVLLNGADNTIRIDSDVSVAEGNDINVTTGARSTVDVDTSGGTADININAGADSNITVNADSVADTDIEIHNTAGGTTTIDALGANVNLNIYGSSRDDIAVYGAYASVYTHGGDDDIDVFSIGADVDAGAGDDHVTVGAAGASVRLGTGNDTAWVGAIGVHLDAGDGNDTINLTATGANILAGAGNDNIHVLAGGANIVAGSGDDTVWAGSFAARIDTGDGNDVVHAGAAGSWIDTGAGDDTLYMVGLASGVSTGSGNDQVYSAAAAQFIHAGDGNNVVIGVGGANAIVTEDGDDLVMVAGGLNVMVTGGGDDDVLAVGHGNVAITEDGDDSVFMVGGIFSTLSSVATPKIDLLSGAGIASAATQLLGSNVAVTGGGDDFITNINVGLSGSVYSEGKSWAQKSVLQKSMYLLDLPGAGVTSTIPSLNISVAGDGNDTVISAGEWNVVSGGHGHDKVVAVGMKNFVFGDSFDLGAFVDAGLGVFSAALSPLVDQIHGGDTTAEELEEVASNINAGMGNTVDGNDTIIAAGKSSLVMGMGGDDSIVGIGMKNTLSGGSGNDLIVGIGVRNMINGDTGDDVIVGFGAANWLMGGAGDDTVISAGLGNIVSTDFSGGWASAVLKTMSGLVMDTIATPITAANDIYTELFTDKDAQGSYFQRMEEMVNTSKGAGHDTVISTGAASLIFTGHGDDTIYAGGIGSFVYAGDGDDLMVSMAGGSILLGGEGDDAFIDLGGSATSEGGDGNDTFIEIGYGILNEYSDYLIAAFERFDTAIDSFLDGFTAAIGGSIGSIGGEINEMFAGIDKKLQDSWLDPNGDLATAGNSVDGAMNDAAGYIMDAFDDLLSEFSTDLFADIVPSSDELGGMVEGFDWDRLESILDSAAGSESKGGDGDDVFVTGFGIDRVSGGEGSDTYVFIRMKASR
jgi:hypothetical protein